jgi:hypothetical protein
VTGSSVVPAPQLDISRYAWGTPQGCCGRRQPLGWKVSQYSLLEVFIFPNPELYRLS